MKLGAILKRFRLRSVQLDGKQRRVDNVDGMATMANFDAAGGHGPAVAPTNWVPSQQDERPRH